MSGTTLYLDDVPHLPDDLLAVVDARRKSSCAEMREAESRLHLYLTRIKFMIRRRRLAWERENNCVIEPEPVFVPQD